MTLEFRIAQLEGTNLVLAATLFVNGISIQLPTTFA
jgi:hypothetical protein